MKKLASYGLAVLFALASIGLASPASADPEVIVRADRDVVKTGQTFRVTAHTNVRCQWLVQWNGQRRVASGKRFTGIFTAPAVSARQRLPLTATCFHVPSGPRPTATRPSSGSALRITVAVPARRAGSVVITVLPPAVSPPAPPAGPAPGGGLPNTGGPDWLLLLAGALSMLGGVVVVRRTARRVEN